MPQPIEAAITVTSPVRRINADMVTMATETMATETMATTRVMTTKDL